MQSKEELQKMCQKILNEVQPLLNEVDAYGEVFHSSKLDALTEQYFREIKTRLVGIYTYLSPKLKRLRSMKINLEAAYYEKLKKDSDDNRTNFVSATANRQASNYVSDIRLLRDMLGGYLETIDRQISLCVDNIIGLRAERKHEE